VFFEQGQEFVFLPEEVDVLDEEVGQDFAGLLVLRGGDFKDDL
jgi:hypothetical protein